MRVEQSTARAAGLAKSSEVAEVDEVSDRRAPSVPKYESAGLPIGADGTNLAQHLNVKNTKC